MKYVDYSQAITDRANITGYYTSDIHIDYIENGGLIPDTAVQITDEQWQDSVANPGKYWVDPTAKLFELAPPLPDSEQLSAAKATRIQQLQSAAETEMLNGYVSGVLGIPHTYDLIEKLDFTALAIAAGRHEAEDGWARKIWCRPDGSIGRLRIAHTADQIQDLVDEIVEWTDLRQDHLEALVDQVENVEITTDLATALAEIEAITY